MYSWTLKSSRESWSEFSWSFRSFNEWKSKFLEEYEKRFWTTFRRDTNNSLLREAIYEEILWVRWSWVFSWKDTTWVNIPEDILEKALEVEKILEDKKWKVKSTIEITKNKVDKTI